MQQCTAGGPPVPPNVQGLEGVTPCTEYYGLPAHGVSCSHWLWYACKVKGNTVRSNTLCVGWLAPWIRWHKTTIAGTWGDGFLFSPARGHRWTLRFVGATDPFCAKPFVKMKSRILHLCRMESSESVLSKRVKEKLSTSENILDMVWPWST